MSNEITASDTDALNRIPKGDMPYYDLFIPRNAGFEVNVIGNNHQMRHFVNPEKGHKYVNQLNPTFLSMEPLLAKIKEPSVLCLRGCELLLRTDFPFQKFNTLTVLEISGCSNLTTLPEKEISAMTQLRTLNLSNLPIQQLPHDIFSSLTNLRSLVLRGCPNIYCLPEMCTLCGLEYLDLSDLLIAALPDEFFSGLSNLRSVILSGCSKISSLPSTHPLRKLEVLDLSHCTNLQQMDPYLLYKTNLKMLDLSFTAFTEIPHIKSGSLTHLFLRDTKVNVLVLDIYKETLKVLDLSGAQCLEGINKLLSTRSISYHLVVLDLSNTGIESLQFFEFLYDLRKLFLRKCSRLVKLPEMARLHNLEGLDISGSEMLDGLPDDLTTLRNLKELNLSGCIGITELREGLFDQMLCLEKLDLSKTSVTHLPSFASLTKLQTLNLSQTLVEKVSNLSNLINLKEYVPPGTDGVHLSQMESFQEKVSSNLNEFHLVSTFISDSGFDKFKYKFKKLDDLFSIIEKSIKPTKTNFRSIRADLSYILGKVDIMESSYNSRNSEELFLELVHVANNLSVDDFQPNDSTNLSDLVRVVAKLKLLVPPPKKVAGEEEADEKKKKKTWFTVKKDEEEGDSEFFNMGSVPTILLSPERCKYAERFESQLTDIQRNCLLYLVFASSHDLLAIKKRMLIQLWYGEGFIDPTTYSNPKQETRTRNDPNQFSRQVFSIKAVENRSAVKEMGQQVLEVLEEKGFIETGYDGIVRMQDDVYNFVKARAKEAGFFNFDERNGRLSPQFSGSQRACLLKCQYRCPSSCKLWLSYANSAETLENFKKIHTLLYVDDPIVDIRTEWFSVMRSLIVLHLASLCQEIEEQINIVDLKFLEELKNMEQLRFLSLEGFAVLGKLPNSICKITNLRVLNLRYCSNLEELPDDIGSVRNLTHMDLTECHLLSELPKGVKLLSKLEVLKGFVITYKAGGLQHTKACTLRELLKLENLGKLNLVVNKVEFPSSKDLQVLRGMKRLYNLKITWKKNYDDEQEEPNEEEALRQSRWKQLKCWKKQTSQSDTEELSVRSRLENLNKLVLCCFPLETAPSWVHQGELQNLEKLDIVGGNLKRLPGDMNQSAWNIKILRLKYVLNLEEDEELLKQSFPKVVKDLINRYPFLEYGMIGMFGFLTHKA